MQNYQQSDSDPVDPGQVEQQPPESFAARRIRVINAVRVGPRRSGLAAAVAMARGEAQAGAGSRPAAEITLVRTGAALPRRAPGAQIADDAGLKPTQKHDPREHFTAEQVAQVRTSLMELGE